MDGVVKLAIFAGAAFGIYWVLKKNSALISPATIPVATTQTGAVPGSGGTVQNPTIAGGIATDALIPGAIYAMDCSSGRYGVVYMSASVVPSSETRQLYIYNSGATSLALFKSGSICPDNTPGKGY